MKAADLAGYGLELAVACCVDLQTDGVGGGSDDKCDSGKGWKRTEAGKGQMTRKRETGASPSCKPGRGDKTQQFDQHTAQRTAARGRNDGQGGERPTSFSSSLKSLFFCRRIRSTSSSFCDPRYTSADSRCVFLRVCVCVCASATYWRVCTVYSPQSSATAEHIVWV